MAFVCCSHSLHILLLISLQLYVTYIVIYAILSATLGAWADRQVRAGRTGQDILKYVGGVQFTVLSGGFLVIDLQKLSDFVFASRRHCIYIHP